MAYQNPYFGQNYPQNFPQYPQNFQQQTQPQQVLQIQNGGFLSIRGEQEARNYPVGVGMSVTFKDETAPYIYTKTMGFSQLDIPRFEKFKLVKEEEPAVANADGANSDNKQKDIDLSIYVTKTEFDAFKSLVEGIEADVEKLKPKKANKKEVAEND